LISSISRLPDFFLPTIPMAVPARDFQEQNSRGYRL